MILKFKKKKVVKEDKSHQLFVIPEIDQIEFKPISARLSGGFVNFNVEGYVTEIHEGGVIIFNIVIDDEITDFRFSANKFDDQENPSIGKLRTFVFGAFKADFFNGPNSYLQPKSNWTKLSNYGTFNSLFDTNESKMINEYNDREKEEIEIYDNKHVKRIRSSTNNDYYHEENSMHGDSDDFEWGGLTGEEAEAGYWNTQ